MMKQRRTNAGFSLLELLLATIVFFSVLMVMFQVLQSYAERESGRATSRYMATVASAVEQVLSNVENFGNLYAAADGNGGGIQLIADPAGAQVNNIARNSRIGIGGPWMQGSRLLSDSFSSVSPMRTPVRILLRISDDRANPNDTPAFEIMLVTATPRPEAVVARAAMEAGAAGGTIRTYAGRANAQAISAYAAWRVTPSAGLQNTNWYRNELLANLNTGTQGSYLVYYRFANVANMAGDYMFRVRDPDAALVRNTMFAPINLGGNDIVGADDINIGNGTARNFQAGDPVAAECIGNVMCVNGTGNVNGSGSISGTMTTTGSAVISDSMQTTGMRVQNGLTDAQRSTYDAQSLFVVDGNGNDGFGSTDLIEVTGNSRLSDGATVQAGELGTTIAQTYTMPSSGIVNTANITDTDRISSTTVSANSLLARGQVRAGVVRNGSVQLETRRAGVIDVYNSDKLVYGSNAEPRVLNAPRITVKESGTAGSGGMRIQDFGTCGVGCGN